MTGLMFPKLGKAPKSPKRALKRTGFKKGAGKPVKRATNDSGKPQRHKKSDLQKAKKQLWELCREITRKRYGNVCFTCGKCGLEGCNKHLGHFITKSTCSAEMAYSLDNLRIQCWHCNINLSGNWVAYEEHLKRDGIDVEELKRRNEKTKGLKYDIWWYLVKIAEYKVLLIHTPSLE